MAMHRVYLFPIVIAVFISAVLLINSVPFFGVVEKRVLLLIATLILVTSFYMAIDFKGS